MKSIKNFIFEKLILNKSIIQNNTNKEWDEVVDKWIKDFSSTDFEYMIQKMEEFLDTKEFDDKDDYEEFLEYENQPGFKNFVEKMFNQFIENNNKQIEFLNKKK